MSSPNRAPSGASLTLLLGLGLVLAGGGHAWAERLRFEPELFVMQEYVTNPTSEERSSLAEDDFVLHVRPSLRAVTEGDKGKASAKFGFNLRRHYELDDLNASDPFGELLFERRLTERLTAFANGRYEEFTDRDAVVHDGVQLSGERPDVELMRYQIGASYSLTPRTQLRFTFADFSSDYEATTRSTTVRDQDSALWNASIYHSLTQRDLLIASVDYRDTEFSEVGTDIFARAEQDDRQTSATLAWRRAWTPLWESTLTGGVRFLESEGNGLANARLGSVPSGRDQRLTLDDSSQAFTGGIELRRRTQISNLRLNLTSETRPSSGETGSIDVRSLGASYARSLNSRLSFSVNGRIGQQKSASEFVAPTSLPFPGSPTNFRLAACQALGGLASVAESRLGNQFVCIVQGDSETDATFIQAGANLSWRIQERWTTFIGYSFIDYEDDAPGRSSFRNQRVHVGFRYAFDLDQLIE